MRFPKIKIHAKNIIAKLFYVSFVFLFGLFGIFGNKSFADSVGSIYQTLTVPGTSLAINVFGPNMIVASLFETAMKVGCGGAATVDDIYVKRTQTCASLGKDEGITSLIDKGIAPGGLAYYTAAVAGEMIEDPAVPTNMALFIDDTFKDNVFGIKPSYAQGGFSNLSQPKDSLFTNLTFDLWKQTRNIALALTGILLAIGAFGIMFRQKLPPQSVVTIGNILPQVPIALIAIVLSYPIVTVCLNLVAPLNDVSRSIAATISEPLIQEVNTSNVLSTIGGAIVSGATPFVLIGTILSALGGGLAFGPLIGFFLLMISLILLFLLIVIVLRFVFESGKIFINWVIITVTFPIIAAFSILPGRQASLIYVLKKLLANLLVLPIMWLTLLVGLAIMATMFVPYTGGAGGNSAGDQIWNFMAGTLLFVPILKFTLGAVFIWTGLDSRKYIETALNVQGSVLSALMPQQQQQRR